MTYILYFCRYHDGPYRNRFHRDDVRIEADDDNDAIAQAEELLAEHAETEYVAVCDCCNWCRWFQWIGESSGWEPGAANPIFQFRG
jgi:hypothetical protein